MYIYLCVYVYMDGWMCVRERERECVCVETCILQLQVEKPDEVDKEFDAGVPN